MPGGKRPPLNEQETEECNRWLLDVAERCKRRGGLEGYFDPHESVFYVLYILRKRGDMKPHWFLEVLKVYAALANWKYE